MDDEAHIRCVRETRVVTGSIAIALSLSVLTSTPAWAGFLEQTGPTSGAATVASWTVPEGVGIVQVILQGAGGGDGYADGATAAAGRGGFGARIEASISVTTGQVLDVGLGVRGGNGGVNASNEGGSSPFGFAPGGRGGQIGAVGAAHYGGGGGGLSALRTNGGFLLTASGGGGGGSAVESNFAGVAQNPRGGHGGDGTGLGGPIIRTGEMWIVGRTGSPGSDPSDPPAGRGGTGGTENDTGQAPGTGGSIGGSNGLDRAGGAGGTNFCSGGGGGAGWKGGGGGGGSAHAADHGCGGGGAGLSIFEAGNRTTSSGASSSLAFGQINWISFNTTSLPAGQVGSTYGQQIEAFFADDTTPNTWSVTPALPVGLALDPTTGEISGAPTQATTGDYTFTASYERFDLGGLIARSSTTFGLTINAAPSPPAPPSPHSGESGGGSSTPNPQQQSAPDLQRVQSQWSVVAGDAVEFAPASNSGGTSNYTVTPSLPAGLLLNPVTGVISGIPASTSTATSYILRAANAQGTSSVEFTLQVSARPSGVEPSIDRSLSFVRFKRGSAVVTPSMRAKVLRITNSPARKSSTFELVATVPESPSAAARTLAHRRGVAIRRLLRSQGMQVESKITLRQVTNPKDSRRVEILTPSGN